MLFTKFAEYIRFCTHTDSTSLADSTILLLANTEKDVMATRILGANENYFGVPMLDDLVAGQREYPLDSTVAGAIKFIEVKLDGVHWKRLYESDFNMETLTTDEAGINSAFTNRPPAFAIFRNSIWILSEDAIIDVTDGIKIWAFVWPADFVNLALATEMSLPPSATTHGWPRQFQKLLAQKVIIAYKESRDKPMTLSQNEQMWEKNFIDQLDGIMHPNQDRSVLATTPYDDGGNY